MNVLAGKRRLPLLGFVPFGAVLAYRVLLPSHICDDAYIALKGVLNLVEQGQPFFNIGENVYLFTSPVWVLLVALGHWAGFDVIVAAKILGALFELMVVGVVVALGRQVSGTKNTGFLAAVLLVSNPRFLTTSFSGMELPVYMFAVYLALFFTVRKQFASALFVAALCVWIRFDGIVILATVSLVFLFTQRTKIKWRVPVPAVLVLFAYGVFGKLCYGDIVPWSVTRKAQVTSVGVLSPEWFDGAFKLTKQFLFAFIGLSDKNLWVVLLGGVLAGLFLVGAAGFVRERNKRMLPVLLFLVLYCLAFIGTGRAIAKNFPWYFLPPVAGAYLFVAEGISRILRNLRAGRDQAGGRQATSRILPAAFAAVWMLMMVVPNVIEFRRTEVRMDKRERLYAAAGIWAGQHLESGAHVAANEIGALAFYLPSRIHVFDMFGLACQQDERDKTYLELLVEHCPEMVVTMENFSYRRAIESRLPGEFVWRTFKTLCVGIRKDKAGDLAPHWNELAKHYESVNTHREYGWERQRLCDIASPVPVGSGP